MMSEMSIFNKLKGAADQGDGIFDFMKNIEKVFVIQHVIPTLSQFFRISVAPLKGNCNGKRLTKFDNCNKKVAERTRTGKTVTINKERRNYYER